MQSLYQTLHHFLSAYAPIWQHEPMASYPRNLAFYPKQWIEEFQEFEGQEKDHKKLFQLYAKTLDHSTLTSSSLATLLEETLALESIPAYSPN
ncbi:MAG: hypothetical protein AABY86_02235, partial [Bdellovibrionota bacterium]